MNKKFISKFLKQTMTLTLINFSLHSTASASLRSGGVDGAGGDALLSTEFEVQQAVAQGYANHVRDALYNLSAFKDKVEDAYVLRVLAPMYSGEGVGMDWEKTQPFYKNLRETKYYFENGSDACEGHMAFVKSHTFAAPVCFNTTLLRGYLKDDLQKIVMGIISHEMAHQFGFKEFEATKFQAFMQKNGLALANLTGEIWLQVNETKIPVEAGRDRLPRDFIVQAGKPLLESEAKREQPFCHFGMHYPFASFAELEAMEKQSGFIMQDQDMKVEMRAQSSYYSSEKPEDAGYTSATFYINPYYDGFVGSAFGAKVTTEKGSDTKAKVGTMTCTGKRLRLRDIIETMGGLADIRQLIQ